MDGIGTIGGNNRWKDIYRQVQDNPNVVVL